MKQITFGQKNHRVWVFSDVLASSVEQDLRDRGHSFVAKSDEHLRTVWDEARSQCPSSGAVDEVHVAVDEFKHPVLASLEEEDIRTAISSLLAMRPTRTLDMERWPVPS